ncbi:hydrogenase small subunit [Sulfurospirillum sp. 1307]|jgi:hydrogenase small subunit
MTRRDALKQIYNVIVGIGASSFFSFDDLMAIEDTKFEKPNLLWMQGASCSGCTLSMTDLEDIPFVDFILNFVNIIYHPNISLTNSEDIKELLKKTQKELKNQYLLVVEGSIPAKIPHACLFNDRPFVDWIIDLSKNANTCIGVGTCASFGGVTNMGTAFSSASPLMEVLDKNNIKTPLINLPNCPIKPEHFAYTILYYIKFKKLPPLDSFKRPRKFFSKTIHQTCIHYNEFKEDIFATKIGEPGCLLELGCQGPVTRSDCMITGHNGNTNNCIKAGHPCIGCASEHFPRQIMFRSYYDERVIEPLKEIYFEK